MNFPDSEHLLKIYEAEIAAAYVELLQSFTDYLEHGMGDPRSMAGRCGAQIGAAHKRCKRGFVFEALEAARREGIDITPTVAENLCIRLIGRGVDFRAALEAFGIPGRTAANKSKVRPDDLVSFEALLKPQVESLMLAMRAIRELRSDEYAERAREAATGLGGKV